MQSLYTDFKLPMRLEALNIGLHSVIWQPCPFRDKAFASVCRSAEEHVTQCSAKVAKKRLRLQEVQVRWAAYFCNPCRSWKQLLVCIGVCEVSTGLPCF